MNVQGRDREKEETTRDTDRGIAIDRRAEAPLPVGANFDGLRRAIARDRSRQEEIEGTLWYSSFRRRGVSSLARSVSQSVGAATRAHDREQRDS